MLLKYIIFIIINNIIHFLGTYRLYKKANRYSWEAIIPIYNLIVMLKIIKRPIWWIFLFYTPIIFIIMYIILWIDLIFCYGKKKYIHIFLVIITLGGYIYFLNYQKNINYLEPKNRKDTLLSSLIFAIIFASFIHIYFIQPFIIPTSSMEKTLLVGDFIFVSKIHYGLRIPMRPISIPFIHNYLSNKKSYLDNIRLPYIRLPAITKIKNNDIVVFNFPEDLNHTAPDRKDNYIKRCVALPGDIIKIYNGIIYINNIKEQNNKFDYQYSYIIKTINIPLNIEYLKYKLSINEIKYFGDEIIKVNNNIQIIYNYIIYLTNKNLKNLKIFSNIFYIKKNIYPIYIKENKIFPKKKYWNRDFYGSIKIPKKGDNIKLNNNNINIYHKIISLYENNIIKYKHGLIYINGYNNNNYIIKQNYYFMIGDNRHNSLDSRYFGFVPENHIVGKPILTWLSIDWDKDNPNNFFKWKFRWDRIITITDSYNSTSYLKYILFIILLYILYNIYIIFYKK